MALSSAVNSTDKDRLRLWLELLRTTRFVENRVRTLLRREFGETLPRFDLMAALHRSDRPMTMSDLSRYLLVSNGRITGIVDHLVEDGLVVRQQFNGDRRTIHVQLTPSGTESFQRMAHVHQGWIDELMVVADQDARRTMLSTLQNIRKGDSK